MSGNNIQTGNKIPAGSKSGEALLNLFRKLMPNPKAEGTESQPQPQVNTGVAGTNPYAYPSARASALGDYDRQQGALQVADNNTEGRAKASFNTKDNSNAHTDYNKQMQAAGIARAPVGGNAADNANRMNARETLRLSRLADKLNAQKWTPTFMGYHGINGQTITNHQRNDVMMPQVETEETRQQETARNMDRYRKQRMASREQRAYDMYFDIEEKVIDYMRSFATAKNQQELTLNLQQQLSTLASDLQNVMLYASNDARIDLAAAASNLIEELRSVSPQAADFLANMINPGYVPMTIEDQIFKQQDEALFRSFQEAYDNAKTSNDKQAIMKEFQTKRMELWKSSLQSELQRQQALMWGAYRR